MTQLNFLDPNPKGFPAVLFLHGLGANGSSWTLQFDRMTSMGIRSLAPDIPGFGGSRYDGKSWSIKRAAFLVHELVEELNCGPVHVVGLSMGGIIAQQYALDYPESVRKLVLVSTFSVLRPTELSQWLYFFQRALVVHTVGLKTQAKIVAQRVFPEPDQEALRNLAEEQISSADSRAYRAAMRSLGLFDSRSRLKEIKSPTLVITGADDSTVSPDRQAMLTQGISGAKQIVIPHAGHAVAIDQYQAFNDILSRFLLE